MADAVIGLHRLVRAAAVACAIAAPILLLRAPPAPVAAAPHVAWFAPPPAEQAGRPVFAATVDGSAVTGPLGGGPPVPVGIVGRLPDDVQAMVRQADGQVRTLVVGQSAGDWTLSGIEADRLRFRRGDQERVLVLPTGDDAGR